MFELSRRSSEEVSEGHLDIQLIIRKSISTSKVDFGVSEVGRTDEKQFEYFEAGKSRCDGITIKSKHQKKPSEAFDIYAYYNGAARWDDAHLCYLGGHIMATAAQMFRDGEVSHELRWGGNWDGDGVIILDQRLKDLPHFELIT